MALHTRITSNLKLESQDVAIFPPFATIILWRLGFQSNKTYLKETFIFDLNRGKVVVDNGLTWPTTHTTQADRVIHQNPKLVAPAQLNRDQASGLLALRSSFATAWACALSIRDSEIWAREKKSSNIYMGFICEISWPKIHYHPIFFLWKTNTYTYLGNAIRCHTIKIAIRAITKPAKWQE